MVYILKSSTHRCIKECLKNVKLFYSGTEEAQKTS